MKKTTRKSAKKTAKRPARKASAKRSTAKKAKKSSPRDQKRYARFIAGMWGDPEYRKRVKANPKKVLKEEGITLPPGAKVHIHEEGKGHYHLVVPPKPRGIRESNKGSHRKLAAQFTATLVC